MCPPLTSKKEEIYISKEHVTINKVRRDKKKLLQNGESGKEALPDGDIHLIFSPLKHMLILKSLDW